jgi:suppressor for copper-sensitivity B
MKKGIALRRSLAIAVAALIAALTLAIGPAGAATTDWQTREGVAARLIVAVDGTGALAGIPAGIELDLAPGWKTYWRSPGDAGLPPALDWAGSENLASATLSYPAPHRETLLGLETFGYGGRVVFPIALAPAEPGLPVDLRLAATFLVCSNICVPQSFAFALSLPPTAPTPDAAAANLIARAENAVPGDGRAAGLAIVSATASDRVLTVTATAREPFAAPDLFVEGGPYDVFAAPRLAFADGGRRLIATVDRLAAAGVPDPLAGTPVTLTLVDGERSMETRVVPASGAPSAPAGGGLLAMVAAAVLGGLILNLMPCVLPVLSLKLMGAVRLAGHDRGRLRRGFLATAAGILVSMLALGAVATALKAGGGAVGWGIQFQEPLFLAFMIVLLAGFAANLFGLFEIRLPGPMSDVASGAGGGFPGNFATGAFATLLATPCSAPFLGVAVGFALARGWPEILTIFAALGIGLALPYLLVAALPGLARLLPRPGRWLGYVRPILGVALLATALWLLAVLAVQTGALTAAAVGAAALAIPPVLFARRRIGGRAAGAAAVALALLAFVAPLGLGRAVGAGAAETTRTDWAPFDQASIGPRVAAGEVVFVDVTADWCLTCKANKLFVLNADDVAQALAGEGVTAMVADWTNPDPAIAAYLARYGRYGIPFYAVYGPDAPDGIVLPELLTEGAVLDALAKAGLES